MPMWHAILTAEQMLSCPYTLRGFGIWHLCPAESCFSGEVSGATNFGPGLSRTSGAGILMQRWDFLPLYSLSQHSWKDARR